LCSFNHLARSSEVRFTHAVTGTELAYYPGRQRTFVEAIVKLFRLLVLMLAIGVFPSFSILAQAQQEVDPDHYEQAQAAQANVHGSKAQGDHKIAHAHHRGHGNARMASKHSGRANHHRARVSA
jgi:ABC-type nickel/cobalt efflux system permease component RcnA